MTKKFFSILLLIGIAVIGEAFSPYNNYLDATKTKRVALIASVKPDHEAAMDAALVGLSNKKAVKVLKQAEIKNLLCYKKVLSGKTWVMIYFDYSGDDYLMAVSDFESAGAYVDALKEHMVPHPLAKRYGTAWLQMEWIAYIRGASSDLDVKNSYAMVTTLKPEKESYYRLLHQAVWPGVCDQMARGNNRNFSIFLVEIDDTIYEFFHVEYVGMNQEKDAAMDRSDPTNLRWWKQTDPCQTPLPGTKDIWAMMDKIEASGQ